MNCLYGKLNSETIKKEYKTSDTIEVDNSKNKLNVIKTPETLTIIKNSATGDSETFLFDGQNPVTIDLHEVDAYTGKENDTTKTIVDIENNTVEVEVKRTPGKIKFEKGGKILTDPLDKEVEFDGSEDTTLHIPETNFEGISSDETASVDINGTTIDVKVNNVPNRLIINNLEDGTTNIFDGSKEVNINLPEKSVKTLIGTIEKPINLATDMEAGHLYVIEGYVIARADNN